ncbi:MAG: hypothetical protein L0L85_11925, partial [Corynebacterium casei]|nr:hypothetical protein [Corynebacterium casei]
MRSDLVSSLPLVLDPEQNLPIPAQLTTQIRALVAQRILSPGDHIPSTFRQWTILLAYGNPGN